mmetsp:Transcript_32452/g.112264  ORF Transcript_32452/g.112264 Transcript_32452/m.112264 type:complete len:346 (-) Transcript_32452:321-1358(-)
MRTWAALAAQVAQRSNLVHGATTAQSRLRLFGTEENAVRVTFYRDHHAWCPYCQKIWLYLEEKRIPYRVKKVTMFCYGNKESWFKAVVPSGMLPAVEIDGRLVTESDVILEKLEAAFGALGGAAMNDRFTVELRQLERQLFSAWCRWLCHSNSRASEEQARSNFDAVAGRVDAALAKSGGPFFRGADFSTADLVFVPYVERMSASLLYYKGYALRDSEKFPRFSAWFDALEKRETYRGTQSDFHTHCHDLPPQMGGCYENGAPEQQRIKAAIDARGLATRDDFGLRAKEVCSFERLAALQGPIRRRIRSRRTRRSSRLTAWQSTAKRCARSTPSVPTRRSSTPRC